MSLFDRAIASIDGSKLLDQVHEFLGRFIAFPSPEAHDAVTLWAAHTHMVQYFHTSGRLCILSPEPESGKTLILDVLNLLVPNPMYVFGASVAAIFRTVARERTTLLFDEVDTIFTKKGKDADNEDLRALLNAGYKRGATIPRCVGPRHDVEKFNVFGAAALAGIGNLPDTIMSRAVIVKMRRRKKTEIVDPFRNRLYEEEGYGLRDQLAAWAEEVGKDAGESWPELPQEITDRAAEAWEPLIAVADVAARNTASATSDWPNRARCSACSGVAAMRTREGSLGVQLLRDIRKVFRSETCSTWDLVSALQALQESPWLELDRTGLTDRRLAATLKQYGVSSRNMRINESVLKGYRRIDFVDVWDRYLGAPDDDETPPPPQDRYTATAATDPRLLF